MSKATFNNHLTRQVLPCDLLVDVHEIIISIGDGLALYCDDEKEMKGSESVLVIERTSLHYPLPEEGTWALDAEAASIPYLWMPREEAEEDENFLQLIPYGLIRHSISGDVWTYRRVGGDGRVLGCLSCGVGGHLEPMDASSAQPHVLEIARVGLMRELKEEIGWCPEFAPVPRAWLYEHRSLIGRTHLGLIYVMDWPIEQPDPQPLPDEPMLSSGFCAPDRVVNDERFELWSRLAAGILDQ